MGSGVSELHERCTAAHDRQWPRRIRGPKFRDQRRDLRDLIVRVRPRTARISISPLIGRLSTCKLSAPCQRASAVTIRSWGAHLRTKSSHLVRTPRARGKTHIFGTFSAPALRVRTRCEPGFSACR